ncbi:hypothetical protein M9458_006144, partial [Cirrhinus mrigala]
MSIAVSEEGLTPDEADESAERPPAVAAAAQSESEAELAGKSTDLEVPKAPSPEHSRLDDWFLGAGSDVPPRSTPVPFFPEVHEELTKTWRAPYMGRSHLSSSLLTTLDGRAATVRLQCTCARKTPPPGGIVPASCPKPAYSAAGQAASALHAMAILQVHKGKALKELHQGGPDPRLMQELRTATDFALRAMKVMSTMVVQERHLWLNLAQMSDADHVRFLDALISQAGLFGDTFSAVQKQTEVIKHMLPQRESTKPPGARPPSAPLRLLHLLHLSATSKEATPQPSNGPAKNIRKSVNLDPHSQKEQFSQSVFEQRFASSDSDSERDFATIAGTTGEGKSCSPQHDFSPERFIFWVGSRSHRGYISDGSVDPTSSAAGGLVNAPQSHWLIQTVRLGYAIQFTRHPPRFRGILFTSVHSDTDASVLRAEIVVLLAKNAIEPVPPAEMKSGFYSPYFIVPKKSGGLRPILDLRILNRSLHRLPFKMLTAKRILSCVRHQDWFAAIDLKDTYFHGRVYQYKVLPFGLALSPHVFSKLTESALSPLWEKGIRILNYLDDWLLIAHSRGLLCEHRDLVLRHLSLLGLQVNWEKSKLSPVQSISFLGMELDSVDMTARLMDECVHRSHSYTARAAPYETASALAIWPDPKLGMAPRWTDPAFLRAGVPLGQVSWHVVVNTDASKTGWGAVCNGQAASGSWTRPLTQARAPSTRQAYALKWGLLADWCSSRQEDPQSCAVGVVLSFLQEKLERRLSSSTLKVYVAAIAAYHDTVDGLSLGKHHLII